MRTALITRFSALGDVAMTIPAVYSACRCYPDVRFVMVTRPGLTRLFINAPSNLEVIGADVNGEYAGVNGMRRLASKLVKDYHPDVMIDLHHVIRTRLLTIFLRLRGVPAVHLIKPRAQRKAITRQHNKIMEPMETQRARYRDVFRRAGLGITNSFDGLFRDRNTAPAHLYEAITAPTPAGQSWIGIAPFAAHRGKIYPPEQMEKVVQKLQAEADKGRNLRVFLFGGGDMERDLLAGWAEKYPCATSLAGKKYGFPAELGLLNHIDVMLSMDSGNMHLAAIAGTPTISIWGATHPYCGFKGWRLSDADIIQLPLPCRPCSVYGNKPCLTGDYKCLTAIRPEVVFNKIMGKLP